MTAGPAGEPTQPAAKVTKSGRESRRSVKIEEVPVYSHSSGSSVNEMANCVDDDDAEGPPSPRPGRLRLRTMSGSKSGAHLLTTKTGRKIYTKGRPPWYDKRGKSLKQPYVIGICGGSASGKTTVAEKIVERLEIPWVTILSMDSFYKVLSPEEHDAAENSDYNFDHPNAFDFDLMFEVLSRLREGKSVEVPTYDFTLHARDPNPKVMYGADVLIFEGILAFHKEEIKELMDMKVFVDTDADLRLARRLNRDINERGRDLGGVFEQYFKFVKPAFDSYIAPGMKDADIIVPRGGDNDVAIDLIVKKVMSQLLERGYESNQNVRERHELLEKQIFPDCRPDQLVIIKTTPQVQGLHTFIRCRETKRDEFIFYSERLCRILFEEAMNQMPYKPMEIELLNGVKSQGIRKAAPICGVAIMRAGETMENSLRAIVKDCKILIQTNETTLDPELHYLRLPVDIHKYKVVLMDATVATGNAAMMAIRILLDHDVPEENIYLCSLVMSEQGAHSIAYAFSNVKLITTAMDSLTDKCFLHPGVGNFGDRYYGTCTDVEYGEAFEA